MTDYLFSGSVVTRAPLAVSPPGHLDRNKRLLLPRMTVLTAAGPVETVIVPGSTIRGRYRHACAEVCLESEKPVSFARYLALTVGGVRGTKTVARVGLQERQAFVDGEPMLALFGAGDSAIGWIPSRLDVAMAVPSEPTEAMVLTGRRGDATSDPLLLEVLAEEERAAVTAGAEANHARSQAAVRVREVERHIRRAAKAGEDTTGLDGELAEARRCVEAAAKAQAEHLGSDVSVLLALPGYEAIPAGTVLGHRMFARGVTEDQMRLLVAGLARFAADPRFGGHRAHGCGRVLVEYDVRRFDGGKLTLVGTIRIDPNRWDDGESSLVLTGEPARWHEAGSGASRAP